MAGETKEPHLLPFLSAVWGFSPVATCKWPTHHPPCFLMNSVPPAMCLPGHSGAGWLCSPGGGTSLFLWCSSSHSSDQSTATGRPWDLFWIIVNQLAAWWALRVNTWDGRILTHPRTSLAKQTFLNLALGGKRRVRRVGRHHLPLLASVVCVNQPATSCSHKTQAAGERCRQCQAAGHELPAKCTADWKVLLKGRGATGSHHPKLQGERDSRESRGNSDKQTFHPSPCRWR